MSAGPGVITAMLNRLRGGDVGVWEQLWEQVSPDLRRIAQFHFRSERPGHVLQPTALIHEVWLKLMTLRSVRIEDRLHFFALCSRFMRRILVDEARRRQVQERLPDPDSPVGRTDTDVLELDRALKNLEACQPRAARVVELRYFSGLSIDEIAEILGVSSVTVKRDWLAARAWLYRQLTGASA